MLPKVKVGDKVRIKKNEYTQAFHAGKEGVIFDGNGYYPYDWKVCYGEGEDDWDFFNTDELTVVEEA
jgi:hypothetical protein